VIGDGKGKRNGGSERIYFLGYTLQKNGGQEVHVKERMKKAAAVMGEVWSIGKRRFEGNWSRRLWLFDRLIWMVLSYR